MKTYVTLLALLLSTSIYAQLENHNWHFSDGLVINFEDPVSLNSDSSIDTPDSFRPAGISDEAGNSLFYTDGGTVFNANGDPMPNGSFDTAKEENLVVPNPDNADQYYIVRSYVQGTDYSLVDMSLDGGLGDIVEGEKEISISTQYSRLLTTSNADDTGRWLIEIFNTDISTMFIQIYDVGDMGFDLVVDDSFNYTWAGWEEFIDDAVITKECDLIAVSFKGHYFTLFGFDNENGVLTDYFEFAIDIGDFFGNVSALEFSASGQYLYTLGSNQNVRRYDISSLDEATIEASEITLSTNGNTATDIKRGPDDKLYVLEYGANEIDVINFPDDENGDVEYENTLFESTSLRRFFPNTPNMYCGIPIPFFNLQPQLLCLGEEANFGISYNFEPDSLFWDFGDPETTDDVSESLNPSYLYTSTGTYNVTCDVWLDTLLYPLTTTVSVFDYPEIDLGPDQTICEGEQAELNANGEAITYNWSTEQNGPSILVEQDGMYVLTASNSICSVSDSVNVIVIPEIDLYAGEDVSLCEEDFYTINANIPGSWSTGDEGTSTTVSQTGTYSITTSNSCFTATDEVTVTFVQVPTPQLPDNIFGCTGDAIILNPQVDAEVFDWSNGEFGSSIQVSSSGWYYVDMVYQGCPVEDSTLVTIQEYIPLESLIIPNIFSPNGDGDNDIYRLTNPLLPGVDPCEFPTLSINMEFYSRWGNLIAENLCEWDGKNAGGDEVSDGVYYYIINLSSTCNTEEENLEVTGAVELVR